MRVALLIGVVIIFLYTIWVVVPASYFERKYPSPRQITTKQATKADPSGVAAPSTGRYRITVEGGKIYPSKKENNCWDPCWGNSKKEYVKLSKELASDPSAGWRNVMHPRPQVLTDQSSKQPDVFAVFKIGNKPVFRTPVAKNTLRPQWGTFYDTVIAANDTLRIYVWDKDALNSDLIGYYAASRIPAKYLAKGGVWKLQFQRVYELKLTIKPLKPGKVKKLEPGRYRVTLLSAVIDQNRVTGKPWDFFKGRPDPYAIIRIGPHQMQTPRKKDTLYPAWNHSRIISLQGDETLRVGVFDKDIAKKDEIIGKCKVGLLKKLKLRDGVLFKTSCGQVKELNIKFDRIL